MLGADDFLDGGEDLFAVDNDHALLLVVGLLTR
jgi:hypothetical protein